MTEMVFGAAPVRAGDPILPRWWRTLDKWALACVLGLFAIGLLLGLAASVPLAEKNNLPRFYYVQRQAVFGGLGLLVMLIISMLPPRQIRRPGAGDRRRRRGEHGGLGQRRADGGVEVGRRSRTAAHAAASKPRRALARFGPRSSER